MPFDLDRYLARIGWDGPREPTFDTLAGVLRGHMTRIPFENLDVLLGRGIRVDLESVFAKLVTGSRGGYCFEHGTLLQAALLQLGFEPTAHTARVIMQRPRAEAPQSHMLLTLDVGGRRFALDPGFGGHAPLVPVPLDAGQSVRDGDDVHRMVRDAGDWVLQTDIDGRATPLWSSTLEPAEPVDFVMANHFVSTFPTSPFVTSLMLRSITPQARVSVFNQAVTVRSGGREETSVITSRAELRALLTEHFGFDDPALDRLRVPSMSAWD